MVVNGILLVFSPGLFLRFNDWFTSGDYESKYGEWRNRVYDVEYRIMGVLMLCFGVYFTVILFRKILA
jgi:hypothetical protein